MKKLMRVLFVMAIAFTTSILAESKGVSMVNEAKADCPVNDQDITDYLVLHGYSVRSATPISGSQWSCCCIGGQTQEYWWVTVNVTGCAITGHSATWCQYCL